MSALKTPARAESEMVDFRYECGLDNLILKDFPMCVDDAGNQTITIPNINQLHSVITLVLALKDSGLQPKEIRFLRTELGLTQAHLGNILGKDQQTIARWEKSETPIDQSSEMVLRTMSMEHIGYGERVPMEQLSGRTVREAGQQPIYIDASNPQDYRPMELEAA